MVVETDGIRRDRRHDDRAEVVSDSLESSLAAARQIQIARSPIGAVRPEPQKHRSLQHEAIAEIGPSEAVEKALEAVARQQDLIIVTGFLRSVEQARRDRGGQVGPGGHAIESR